MAPPAQRRQNGATPPARRRHRFLPWLPLLILLGGSLLRLLYAIGSDPRNVYDDHFHVIRIMVREGRWPRPDEDWETYQPPLYHLLGALVYRTVAGPGMPPSPYVATPEAAGSPQGVPCPYPRHVAGRKAVQLISTFAGIATLGLVWLALRRLFPGDHAVQSVGLAFAALLPRHIYMSGMATNDALTYFWTTLALYAVLRALPRPSDGSHVAPPAPSAKSPGNRGQRAGASASQRPHPYRWWIAAGLATALALWTKQYAVPLLGVLVLLIPAAAWVRQVEARRLQMRGAAAAVALAVLLGMWPYVRLYRHTGDPLASNVTLRPNNIRDQLPGTVANTSFASLRLRALLHYPWTHVETVDSFWTQVYGELWFDHGTASTIYQYWPWLNHLWPILRDQSLAGPERDRRGLTWVTDVVHPGLLRQGRMLIALGLLPTLLCLLGLVTIWRQPWSAPIGSLIVATFLAGFATPLLQTLRVPHRCSMKATYALWAIGAFVLLFAAGWSWLCRQRFLGWLRWVIAIDLGLLAVVVCWHFIDLAVFFPRSPGYFARRDPL